MTLNNTASIVALGNLNKNVKRVGATLAKLASGDRIPSAKYDSAGLAVDNIINNIRRLKELAINSANDSNSDMDRATIQKEVNASLSTIDDIAVGTEYNERKFSKCDHFFCSRQLSTFTRY